MEEEGLYIPEVDFSLPEDSHVFAEVVVCVNYDC